VSVQFENVFENNPLANLPAEDPGEGLREYVGRYEIVRLLGKGATGAVYLALDPFNDDRKVAVKIAFPKVLQNADEGGFYKSMFLNEAALAGKVIHPHIAQIYDAVVEDRSTYIVMEYVEGATLEQQCKPNNLLPVDDVCEIIFKCVRGFAFAHAEGMIHRDIKPGNIMRTGGTSIKIVDFGASLNRLSGAGQNIGNVGSPAYMAPELVNGDAQASHQSDIYALGVTMYYLLAGRLPYAGSSATAMMYSIANMEAEPLLNVRADVPASVAEIVHRAIARDRSNRYASWEQFGKAIAAISEANAAKAQKKEVSETQRFELLKTLPFFKNFPENELWEVIRISRWASFGPETQLIKEGDSGDSFFIIAQGNVKITRQRKLLNVLGTGDCVGEMAYLSSNKNALRSASVTTTTDSIVMKIRAADLHGASSKCQQLFDRKFMEALVDRLQLANEQLASLSAQ
jgi:eukaryotic-like serine/threonine-protein kinase